jgi:hypothetical protein
MARAIRCLLHFASERERVRRKSSEQCARSWWEMHYLKLPGVSVKEKDKEDHFARFLRVVNAFLEETVVWTGQPGARCDEYCGGEECDGRHVGLAVACSGLLALHQQLAVVWNNNDLINWKADSTRGRASITSERAVLIRLFLDSQNNVVSVPNGECALMVGVWGLAEHSCAAGGIQVQVGNEISNVDCHGHPAKWGFRLCRVECELQLESERLVWNYGQEFARRLDPCACTLCFKNKKLKN